jgi:hypothetical protein
VSLVEEIWQNARMTKLLMTALLLTQTLSNGYWPVEKSQPIIDKTQTILLSPDISKLSEGERKAVARLMEAGQIFQKLYEEQRHPEALSSYQALVQLDKRGCFRDRSQRHSITNENRFCRSIH